MGVDSLCAYQKLTTIKLRMYFGSQQWKRAWKNVQTYIFGSPISDNLNVWSKFSYGNTDMAISSRLLMLIKNIYIIFIKSATSSSACYIILGKTKLIYPFTSWVTNINIILIIHFLIVFMACNNTTVRTFLWHYNKNTIKGVSPLKQTIVGTYTMLTLAGRELFNWPIQL